MSITFRATCAGFALWRCDCADICDDCWDHMLNVSNSNGSDLLRWLGISECPAPMGDIKGTDLAARCRRRLWDEDRNFDPELTAEERAEMLGIDLGGRVITTTRPAGYLRDKTKLLLKIAEQAGDDTVSWD